MDLNDNRRDLLLRLKSPKDYIILSGICTLTLIAEGKDLHFLMMRRGKEKVAYAMGTFHVIPAGEFQPACTMPSAFRGDFDIWKNIMREYAEEISGLPEHDPQSTKAFDYMNPPCNLLQSERQAGNIKVFYLGTGLDLMTFQAEILAIVVFKKPSFYKIFDRVMSENQEGTIYNESETTWGAPFTEVAYNEYTKEDRNILASGEVLLNIAWEKQEFFKTCFSEGSTLRSE